MGNVQLLPCLTKTLYHINCLTHNHNYYIKLGSKTDMVNIKDDKTNTRGENEDS